MEKYVKKLRTMRAGDRQMKEGGGKKVTETQIITQIDIKLSVNMRDIFI